MAFAYKTQIILLIFKCL